MASLECQPSRSNRGNDLDCLETPLLWFAVACCEVAAFRAAKRKLENAFTNLFRPRPVEVCINAMWNGRTQHVFLLAARAAAFEGDPSLLGGITPS